MYFESQNTNTYKLKYIYIYTYKIHNYSYDSSAVNALIDIEYIELLVGIKNTTQTKL